IGGVAVQGTLSVGVARPFPVQGAVDAQSAAALAARVQTTLGGTLEQLQIASTAETTGARSTLEAVLAPFTARPLARLRAELSALDLHAFDARLPRTSPAGRLALADAGEALAGTLDVVNALSGTYDRERLPLKSLRATVRTDMTTLQMTGLDADLGPAGQATGSGTLAVNRVALA